MALVPFPGTQSTALQLPPEDPEESSAGKMSFLEHLDELRRRIIHSVYALIAGVVAALWFHNDVYNFVFAPTRAVLPPNTSLAYMEPSEAFTVHVTVALIAGLILAAPYIMYQVWMFIAPGLYSNEAVGGWADADAAATSRTTIAATAIGRRCMGTDLREVGSGERRAVREGTSRLAHRAARRRRLASWPHP